MSQEPSAKQTDDIPKWIPAGTAVLGAFYAYFSIIVVVAFISTLFQLTETQPSDYGTLLLILVSALISGAGLQWLARRYQSPWIQAGGLVGVGIMIPLLVVVIIVAPRFGPGPSLLLVLAGFGLFITIFPLTANPSEEADEVSGIDILRGSLPGGRKVSVDGGPSHLEGTKESTSDGAGYLSEHSSGLSRRLPVSKYWLIVGSAFAVTIPIAFINAELGVGLLSAFLTAYALSHRIENESNQ